MVEEGELIYREGKAVRKVKTFKCFVMLTVGLEGEREV